MTERESEGISSAPKGVSEGAVRAASPREMAGRNASEVALTVDPVGKAINDPLSLSEGEIHDLLVTDHIERNTQRIRYLKESLVGDRVLVRGSIEISNCCRMSCNYCGMSRDNTDLARYRLNLPSIKDRIRLAKEIGVDLIHISSAEDPQFPLGEICETIAFVKDQGMETVLVLGMRKREEYEKMFAAGARRYTMKIESSDMDVFRKATNYPLEKRKRGIATLREVGFDVGSGVIIGLPDQTTSHLVSDIRFLQELKPAMSSASVFIPNVEAVFRDQPKGDQTTAFRFNVLMRILLRDPVPRIPASSSFGHDLQQKLLETAANVVSINLTPDEFAQNYSMYGGRDRLIASAKKIQALVEESGLITNLHV